MPDTRAIASLNRQTKQDEDRKRWAIEQAAKLSTADSVVSVARSIEDYVTGRTTS